MVDLTAAYVYRDFEADGIPSSGNHDPKKSEIRALLKQYETIISAFTSNGGLIYSSRASLYADLGHAANSMAWVMGDANAAYNGIYRKIGVSGSGSWVRVSDLPFSFIRASNSGSGTTDAIQATTDFPVSASALVLLNIVETNTGSPVTVSFNGGPAVRIKTNSNNDVAAGGLTADMRVLGTYDGTFFRLVTDQVSGAIVAQAEAAADRAEAAALSVVSYIQSPLKVSSFCQGDGTNEDGGLSAFFAELVSKQVDGVIDLPVRFASTKNVGAYFGTLSGAGEGRLINSGGTDGLVFDYSGVTSGYARPLCLENLELLTETDGLGTAIRYTGSDYINMTQIHSVEWDRIRAYGVDDTKGWHKFAQFRRANNGVLYNPSSQGRSSFASPGYMSVGLEFLDGCNFFDIHSPILSWMATAVKVTNSGEMTEAIRLHGGVIQATQIGFLSDAPGAHHVSTGVHYDVTRVGIWWGVDNIIGASDFSFAVNNWIIRAEAEPLYDPDIGRVRDFVAILANSNDNVITDNEVWVPSGLVDGYNRQENSYGIVVASNSDPSVSGLR